MVPVRHSFEVEIRETEGREPALHGVMLTEGVAASERRELFLPGSVSWPHQGIGIAPDHRMPTESRAHPVRQRDGRLTLTARATNALKAAVEAGKRHMSVEFVSIEERTGKSGIREIVQALVVRAALTATPEYTATAAEIRSTRRPRIWL